MRFDISGVSILSYHLRWFLEAMQIIFLSYARGSLTVGGSKYPSSINRHGYQRQTLTETLVQITEPPRLKFFQDLLNILSQAWKFFYFYFYYIYQESF